MDSVQPLRISKNNGGTPSSTPNKMATSRPLAEIGSTNQRRNSPSYNQATRKMIVSRESSPYTENSSPFSPGSRPSPSPNNFRGRMSPFRFDENTPDRSPSPSVSPKRRTSIERLKQSGRVKNSNIFALENKDVYDPASLPIVERPTANRPLSQQLANNSFTRFDSLRKENNPLRSPQRGHGHKRSETELNIPLMSPSKELSLAAEQPLPISPEKTQASPSPTKSSMARTSMFGMSPPPTAFDPEKGTWSDEERAPTPRALHRHNKSVTFHADPPVVNEYEQQTPEPSVSVGSREGSWESDEYDDPDYSFERGSSAEVPEREDSFDEDLENADKTPVVLPEDWSRMSPEEARTDLVNNEDDVFDEPSPDRQRIASDSSESRPLPPLPGFMAEHKRRDSDSLAAAAERASLAARNLPSPPKRASCSMEEILKMTRESSLGLDDRLQLTGRQSGESQRPATSSSHQSSEQDHGQPEELTITNLDTGEKIDVQVRVAEAEVEDDSVLNDFSEFATAPPRISRESILRKVRNTKYDFEDENDSEGDVSTLDGEEGARPSYAELARMDPDQPVQSRENSRETSETYLGRFSTDEPDAGAVAEVAAHHHDEVAIKPEPTEDDGIDLDAIPAIGDAQLQAPRSPSRMDSYERQSSVLHHGQMRSQSTEEEDDDDASHYSDAEIEPEAESTVLHAHEDVQHDDGKETLDEAMQLLTVKDYSEPHLPTAQQQANATGGSFMGLPAYLSMDDYDFGMNQYITPSPPASTENTKQLDLTAAPKLQPSAELGKATPPTAATGVEISPPGTPDSVIQHRSSDVSSLRQQELEYERYVERVLPEPEPEVVIPERRSTIKTSGKLKARPSASQADFEMMAEQRRMVSQEMPVPAIPTQYRDSTNVRPESQDSSEGAESSKADSIVEEKPSNRRQSRKMLNLDIPQLSGSEAGDLTMSLDMEFDRVIESQKVLPPPPAPYPPPLFARFDAQPSKHGISAHSDASAQAGVPTPYSPHHLQYFSAGANVRKQKGYLMRQNTKVVIASNRNVSGDSNSTAKSADSSSNAPPMSPTFEGPPYAARRTQSRSPRKGSAEQFLKTEPWNGKMRRKSVRNASAQKSAAYVREAAAPPLPGHESALGVVDEDYAAGTGNLEGEVAEGTERGRLFVKVVGVKELELPMPRNDRIYFQLTLDNGLHCVTTADLELGKNAPIGQEFELVVQEDLEFQLTLTTKLPPPLKRPESTAPISPTKSVKSTKSGGFASRFLTSPRKRAERERQEREAAEVEERQRLEEERRMRVSVQPTSWDLLHELVNAQDGSFARSYVNLKAHERDCFGRQLTVDVPCYNEWALEKDTHVVNSVRSKRGVHHAGPIRRPPYVVGKLELQLLYVPKPKGAMDEDMPKSMGSAIREMGKASEVKEVGYEGHLSQQGGDCQHWRRRFFRLQSSRLTAYHEHTHQKRAVINLSKASRLVDDKSTLVADPNGGHTSKGRRKSAFAEEDEGYQYVEEGFRIRFANGETIDFYADSRAEKERWMQVLSQVIGKPDVGKKAARWTDLVLARERATSASDSPIKPSPPTAGIETHDFTRPSAPIRAPSERKPLPKSAPTSPMKAPPTSRPPPPPAAGRENERPRARTPPMAPRTGHRSRDAVKSMIF